MQDLSIGSEFAGHRLESILGAGGMGVVYLAVHERLKQRRALKVISPHLSLDAEFRRRFERESEVAASIEHPHVIPIYDAGDDDGQLYIAMRYVDGTDLARVIDERGRLDPALAAEIVRQVASALDAAHARGLVHRDVKPANVLVSSTGEPVHSYLTDFGLTKVLDTQVSGLTAPGEFVGTLDYIAPEQLSGRVAASVDVYALGCLAYHALAGEVPYPQSAAAAKMWAHINAPPPLVDGVSGPVAEAVARAMAKDPATRFRSAGEFGQALTQALGATTVPARTKTGRQPAQQPPHIYSPTAVETPALAVAAPPASASPVREREARPRRGTRRRRIAVGGGALLAVSSVATGIGLMLAAGHVHGRHDAAALRRIPGSHPAAIRVDTTHRGAVPYAGETIDDAAARVKSLAGDIEAGRCNEASTAANARRYGLRCDSGGRDDYRNFQITGIANFGSAGVIEITDAETHRRDVHVKKGQKAICYLTDVGGPCHEERAYSMALDATHRFAPAGAGLPRKLPRSTLGIKPRKWNVADKAAVDFLRSVRDRDCRVFYRVTLTPKMQQREACRRVLHGTYDALSGDLRSGVPVRVFRLGATADFYFWGVRVGPHYRTLVGQNERGLGEGSPFIILGATRATS